MFSSSFSCHLICFHVPKISVNLLHLPNDLLLEDRQDCIIVTNLLEHHTTVKLVAHFLEIEPKHKHKCKSTSLTFPHTLMAF